MEYNNIKFLKMEKMKNYFSIRLEDKKNNIKFWLDCSLIDGYGNHENYKTEDLYIDWEFNQYIFHLDYIEDIKAKKYQENGNNIDNIQEFLDNYNNDIINLWKKEA